MAEWGRFLPRSLLRPSDDPLELRRVGVQVEYSEGEVFLHLLDEARDKLPRPSHVSPPHYPYLAARDRETLVPDRALQRVVWRTVGSPGVLLVDGRIAGTWRPRKSGRRLSVTVEPFEALSGSTRSQIDDEACVLSALRGCTETDLRIA